MAVYNIDPVTGEKIPVKPGPNSNTPAPAPPVSPNTYGEGGYFDASAPVTIPNATEYSPPIEDYDQQATEIEDAMFNRAMRLLQPEFDLQQERMQQRLANQGLAAGGRAYNFDWDNLMNSQNRAMMDAADQAVLAGRNEAQRLFGNQFQTDQMGLDDAARNRAMAIQQMLGIRGDNTANRGIDAQRYATGVAAANNAAQIELARQQADAARRQFDMQHQFNLGQQAWQNAFSDRDWMFNAGLGSRNQFMNEMNQFLGAQYPQLGMPNVPLLDATGAYGVGNQSGMNNFNAGLANRQSALDYNAGLYGALGNLGGSLIGMPLGKPGG